MSVDNAGIGPFFARAAQLVDDELREIVDTNLIGPLLARYVTGTTLFADGGWTAR